MQLNSLSSLLDTSSSMPGRSGGQKPRQTPRCIKAAIRCRLLDDVNPLKALEAYSSLAMMTDLQIVNHMRKLAHLYHAIVWYKCKSLRLRMWYGLSPNFHFCCFRATAGLYTTVKLSAVLYIKYLCFLNINLSNDSTMILRLYTSIAACVYFAHILFRPNHPVAVMTSYRFFMMAAMAWPIYSRCVFNDSICLRRSKSIFVPNFGKISQSTAELLLLPVSILTYS